MASKKLGELRRAQLLYQGPGSIVDFRTDDGSTISVILAGTRTWPESSANNPNYIKENELANIVTRKINERYKDPNPEFKIESFRSPPVQESDEDSNNSLSAYRFPKWLFCNSCNKLKPANKWVRQEQSASLYCGSCSTESEKVFVVPTRFLISCEDGHIDDFPWKEWLNKFGTINSGCEHNDLRYIQDNSDSSLSGVIVKCNDCGSQASLGNVFNNDYISQLKCSGKHPHLGDNSTPDQCDKKPKVVLKGASNSYFPVHESIISIPPYSDWLTEAFEPADMQVYFDLHDDQLEGILKLLADQKGHDFQKIKSEFFLRRDWFQNNSESPYIFQEYLRLKTDYVDEEMDSTSKHFEKEMMIVPPSISPFVETLGKILKLREVKALLGFKRLNEPLGSSISGKGNFAPLGPRRNWLPAIEVFGEGIFFSLNEEKLKRWEQNSYLKEKAEQINAQYDAVTRENLPPWKLETYILEPIITPRFILLHTLSHAIMNQLSLDCGYSVASLKERLYVSDQHQEEMSGILIYTSSSDSEGTLGSLSEKAEPNQFEYIFKAALNSIRICSDDPNCIEGINSHTEIFNGAACHSCVVLPENCCIHFNRFLDRSFLVGNRFQTEEEVKNFQGFFEEILEE